MRDAGYIYHKGDWLYRETLHEHGLKINEDGEVVQDDEDAKQTREAEAKANAA